MKAIIIITVLFMFLFCVAFFLAEFKASRWNNDYQLLKSLIANSDVTQKAYYEICQEFDDFDFNNEKEEKLRKQLWANFQYKYRDISGYRAIEDDEFSPMQLDVDRISRDLEIVNKARIFDSNE